MAEEQRDLRVDLAICNAATPGPWERMNAIDVFTACGGSNLHGFNADDNDGWQIADCNVGVTFVNGEEAELSLQEKSANARFIAEARTGWSHAIERALRAETAVEVWKLSSECETRRADIAEAEVERLKREYAELKRLADDWRYESGN